MGVRPVIIPALLAVFASIVPIGAAAGAREIVVYVAATGFSMHSATIAPGDRVRFTVRDRKNHQVWKSTGSAAGDVPPNVLEGQGASVTLTIADAGAYTYVDRLSASQPEFRLVVRR